MSTQQYRQIYRKGISRHYRGWVHAVFVLLVCCSSLFFLGRELFEVSLIEWLTFPIMFLYGNLVEYLGHRFVMHIKRPYLTGVFRRHTLEHHSFFTDENMEMDEQKDIEIMLFPVVLLAFFFLGIALPTGYLIYLLSTKNVALLYTMTAIFYYFNYEVLHFSYHLPKNNWWANLWFIQKLKHHHLVHHDKKLMGQYNFNISYPIFDWVFRTTYTDFRN